MPTTYEAERGAWDSSDSEAAEKSDQELLKRIRRRFDYMTNAWKDIRDEAELDMKALSTSGPWPEEERTQRVDVDKRPCLHLDQLTQYVNAVVNQIRSAPIGIDVQPAGSGSTNETANLRADRIRQIEYECDAMQAYQTAFECAVSHSYGAIGVILEPKAWDSFQQVIRVRRFLNSNAVLWDPDCKKSDFSDMRDAFVIDWMPLDDFKERYGDARITSFGSEVIQSAQSWFDQNQVQIAEYWYEESETRRMLLVEGENGREKIFTDQFEGYRIMKDRFIRKDGYQYRILQDRNAKEPQIKMCLTNGVEILDRADWPGKWVPIAPVVGKEKYVAVKNKVKRMIDSYIRMARDGQMLFDFYNTCEAESVGLTPKTPWVGYEGQFNTQSPWNDANRVPQPYMEVKAVTEESQGQVLPLPQRAAFEPPIQMLEIGKESARRSIQAAVASYGFTRLDDTNVKSGIALEKVRQQNDMGAYHFIDNYKIALKHVGRIINDLLDDVEGSEQMEVGLVDKAGKHSVVEINGETGKRYRLEDEAQHEVTISTGPHFESQREEAQSVGDSLISNMAALPLEPLQKAKVLALILRLKELGPIGEEMVKIVDPQPDDQDPEQMLAKMQQVIQQLQTQLQQMQLYTQQVEVEKKKLEDKVAAQVLKIESTENIEALKAEIELAKIASTENLALMQQELQKIQVEIEALRQPNASAGQTAQ